MSMREKMINALDRDRKWPDAPETADAIIAALPDMIKPLEWAGFVCGPYEIVVYDGGIADLFCHSIRDEDGNPELMRGGYLTLVSIDDLKAAANAHHVATIMEAFE